MKKDVVGEDEKFLPAIRWVRVTITHGRHCPVSSRTFDATRYRSLPKCIRELTNTWFFRRSYTITDEGGRHDPYVVVDLGPNPQVEVVLWFKKFWSAIIRLWPKSQATT